MGAAYSSSGRTKVLYATSFVLLGAKAKFLRRKPSVLVAFPKKFPLSLSRALEISWYYRVNNKHGGCM